MDGQLIDPPIDEPPIDDQGHEAIGALAEAVQQHYPNRF
ncbi:hypothetical protein BH24ACT26_BH24ACT26_22320 [soil metagenome]